MSSGGEAPGVTGGQSVAEAGMLGFGGVADGVLVDGTGGGGGGYGQDSDRDRQLIRWEDIVTNVILGKEANTPLVWSRT